jgi:hypothetical protein
MIPASATVVSATLALTFQSWVGPQTLLGDFVGTPWDYASPTLGWTSAGNDTAWAIPGIGAGDVDGVRFRFSGIDASGYQRKTVALDAAGVQDWVRDPASNQGLRLQNKSTGKLLRIYSSEAATAAQRPTLSVTYAQ